MSTIQEAIEGALGRVADSPVALTVAGRTDAGVHALCQVAHFDTQARRSPYAWVRGANANLPEGISLLWAQEVPPDFHARFSATGRIYRYLILNRPQRPALHRHHYAWIHAPLDEARMGAGAVHLLGRHDFSAFRAAACQAKHPVRELRRLDIVRQGDRIALDLEANAFLHHMVRNIAGVLVAIGEGKREPGWAAAVLAGRDRRFGGITAPPEGLYFIAPQYPPRFSIPPAPTLPW